MTVMTTAQLWVDSCIIMTARAKGWIFSRWGYGRQFDNEM